jgi:hypothetical protein
MNHPELMPLFATAIAIELAHLRWIILSQWHCRGCRATHMKCDCKYGWLKRLL